MFGDTIMISGTQDNVSLPSTGAGYAVAGEVVKEALLVWRNSALRCFEDNQVTAQLTDNPLKSGWSKHIDWRTSSFSSRSSL